MLDIHDHESHSRPSKRPRADMAVGQNMEVIDSISKEEEETQILQEKNRSCDQLSLSSLKANCRVQSNSAFCMTSSTCRLSDPETCALIVSCKCMCHESRSYDDKFGHEARSHDDKFGYLLEASDEELGIPTEIHYVGTCEINGLFGGLQNLEANHAWNGGHDNPVCIEEVGELAVWDIKGHCDVYGSRETSEAVKCSLNDLEHGSPVSTIV